VSDLTARLQSALGTAYRLENELGGGGMSRVFVAEDLELGRKVVVKVLPPEMAAGVNADRFRREIKLAASLQHPHIVPLLHAGRADDLVWYTMPLIEGESLRTKLARERELPVGEAVRILRDVADALAYAHQHGVVHRDITPDNVLLSGRHAVVTDFGVAKAISEATGAASITSIGVALGTPAYMAPEQAAAEPNVDYRADIYALGALAYEVRDAGRCGARAGGRAARRGVGHRCHGVGVSGPARGAERRSRRSDPGLQSIPRAARRCRAGGQAGGGRGAGGVGTARGGEALTGRGDVGASDFPARRGPRFTGRCRRSRRW